LRKSVALLLTISFIIVALGIISSIFIFFKKITDTSFEYSIAEDSFIIKTVENKMKKVNIKNEDDLLKLLMSSYEVKIDNFKITATFQSAHTKINPNRYLTDDKINESMDFFMNNLCDKYNIKECDFFKNLILDTIDTNNYERSNKSEIILYKPFINGRIYNKKQFQKIVNYYEKITGDKNIEKVPFDKIFEFDTFYTDCNNISPEVAYILGTSPTCMGLNSLFSKKFLQKLGIILFNKNIAYYVWINVNYKYFSTKRNLKILYDLKNKRIIKIEKHILY
jgi:hypothetical protein